MIFLGEQLPPFPVNLDPDVERELDEVIDILQIPVATAPPPNECTTPFNLIFAKPQQPVSRDKGIAGVIPWSPSQVNWNPWTSCNIDEGPLANVWIN